LEVFWLLDFLPLHKSLKTLGTASSLLLPKSSSTAHPEFRTNSSLSAFYGLLALANQHSLRLAGRRTVSQTTWNIPAGHASEFCFFTVIGRVLV